MNLRNKQLALNCNLIDLHSVHSIKLIIAKKKGYYQENFLDQYSPYEHFVVRLIVHV